MTKDTGQEIGQGKVCTKCGEWKLLGEYQRDSAHKTGYRSQCKECVRLYKKVYRAENADRIREYHKNRYAANPEKSNAKNKEWREKYPEKESSRKKKWREENPEYYRNWQRSNPEKVKRYQDKYYAENKEERNRSGREWRRNNPDKQREITRAANAKRSSTIRGRLERSIRIGIYSEIRRGSKHGRRTFDLLDFNIEELKTHLERQFKPGMSWSNYGKGGWHIDHIIPLSAHNYETPDDLDFKKAWALTNLQPLWEIENLSKRNKLFSPFQPSLAFGVPANDNNPRRTNDTA